MGQGSVVRGGALTAAAQAVMGTSIVSIDLLLDDRPAFSHVLMWLALALWGGLALGLGALIAVRGPGLRRWAREVASLSWVAGTAVLGTRLTLEGWEWAGIAMAVIGGASWGALLPGALRRRTRLATGSSFLLVVSTASLCILVTRISMASRVGWLLIPVLALLVLAAFLYARVAVRFDRRELTRGNGDQWIAGGALAILALATAELAVAVQQLGEASWTQTPLRLVAGVFAFGAALWLLTLLATELARLPPTLHIRRLATVFPIGMYAAMSSVLGRLLSVSALSTFASFWTWVAVACWAAVAVTILARLGPSAGAARRSGPRRRRLGVSTPLRPRGH